MGPYSQHYEAIRRKNAQNAKSLKHEALRPFTQLNGRSSKELLHPVAGDSFQGLNVTKSTLKNSMISSSHHFYKLDRPQPLRKGHSMDTCIVEETHGDEDPKVGSRM